MNAALITLIVLTIAVYVNAAVIYVCESSDANFLGTYLPSVEWDGVPTYTNANERTFFRNNGFWYLGNTGPWPPETHYRCVDPEEPERCNFQQDFPPSNTDGRWVGSARFNDGKPPVISLTPCEEVVSASAVSEEL